MNYVLSICILIFAISKGNAQNQLFERISTKNGLPSSNINDLNIDKKGYLWLATANGLFRYDGYSFTKVINNTNIINIDSDRHASLYGMDGKSFFKLNTKNYNYSPVLRLDYNDADPNNDQYNNIFVDHHKNIWSCDFNNVKKYDPNKKSIKQWKIVGNNANSQFANFVEDGNNQVWIAANNGLYKYDETSNSIINILNNYNFHSITFSDGQLLLGTNDGNIVKYVIGTKLTTIEKIPSINSSIKFIVKENQNTFWIGGYGHLVKYNPYTKRTEEIKQFTDINYDFRNAVIDAKNEILWIATDAGLLKHRLGISKEIQKIDLPKSLVSYPIKINDYLEIKQNQFYIALSKSGILEWNSTSNTFDLIPFASGDDNLNTIIKSYTNEIFVSGRKGVYKIKNKKLVKIISSSTTIQSIIVDHKDRLWILPYKKEIEVYNVQTLEKLFLWPTKLNEAYFKLNSFFDVYENRDGTIWLTGWFPKGYGICYYDEDQKTILENADFNDHKLFIGDYYYNITQQKNTSNLVFTGYGGSNMVDSCGNIFNRIEVGFSINNINIPTFKSCIIDTKGSHWLSSTEGLYYVSKDKQKIARISEYDGLSDNNVSGGFYLSSDNKLLMSHTNQIEILDINEFGINKLGPNISMSSAKILGKNKFVNLDSLIFERNENNLSFDFTTLTYNNPSQNHFQFKVAGSSEWIDNRSSNNITFSNLTHGNHSFELKVGDNLGNWSSKPIVFSFFIKPLFYEKTGFKILIASLALSMIIGFIKAKLNTLKKENENRLNLLNISNERSKAEMELISTKELLKSSQLDALRSQMNPHFIFNSLNSIENYILKNERLIASEYLGKFSKLIRDILENSKSENISLLKEIETLQLYIELERIRNNNNFDVTFNIAQNVLEDNILVPPMLMQPHVENAILHGLRYLDNNRGQLTISMIIVNDEYLEYTLQDNGIGRQKSKDLKTYNNYEHKSYGLDITQTRIDIYNQKNNVDISYQIIDLFDNGKSAGTKIIITIPI
jgi:sensor histidine kinase YesM/ligand-binding sensor domain-containing protein